jgi:hypothetical protein
MKRSLQAVTFLLAGAAFLVAAVAVWALWTVTGSGSSSASTDTLQQPTITEVTTSSDTVTIDWSTVIAPGGGAVDGYYVQRYAGAEPSSACASSPATLLTAVSCTDTGLSSGTYTYRVTAVFKSWTGQSDPSDPVTVVADVVAPTATITFPADGGAYRASSYGAGCAPTGICGTAADATGVESVTVSIRQGAGDYWDGSAFASTTEVFNPAVLATPDGTSTDWAYALSLPPDGVYTVHVQAADTLGNAQTGTTYAAGSTFTIDTVLPADGALTVNGEVASGIGSTSSNTTGSYPIDARSDYTDAGSGLASSTLTRRTGTLSNNTCAGFGSPTTIVGTPAQAGLADGCYLYTLTGTDNAGNAASVSTTVKVDTTAPTGGSVTANGGNTFNTSGSVAVAVVNFADAGSGIATNTLTRAAGTLSGNVCGTLSGSTAVTISGGNDSATLATGCYQYTLTATDNVGHTATATSGIVKVDTTAPSTPTLAFSGLSSNVYDAGSNTLYFRPASGGTFTVTASSTDADTLVKSGNTGYTFSSLAGNGFTGTQSGGQVDYTFGAGATQPGTGPTVFAGNNAGANSANASYSLVSDATLPTGGSVTANGGNTFNTTGTVAVAVANFTDAGSGIASNVLTRAAGTLSGNSCGSLSGSTAVTVTSGNDSATLATGCYQYTLTGTDRVGNVATAQSGVIKVDTTAPSTPTLAFSGLSSNASYNSGSNTLYFRPASGGTFTVTASSTDADTLVKSGNAGYTFSSLAGNGFTGTQSGGQMGYTFGSGATQPGTGPTVLATNNAGANSANATYSLVADATLPTGGSVAANGGNTFNTTGTVALSVVNFSDAGSGIVGNSLTRATGTLSGNVCGTLSGTTAVTVSGGNDSAILATGCYQYTLTGTDRVGNVATAQSGVIKVDTGTATSAVTFPIDTYYYASTAWTGGCSTTGICGTAADAVTGVSAVAVSIKNTAGLYWNGTAFLGTTETFNAATLGTPSGTTTTWSYAMSAPVSGVYVIHVRTTDTAGNITPAGSYTTSTFKLGTTGLTIGTISIPSNHKATFSGTAGTALGDNATVTVKVCSTTGSGGPVPNFATCAAEGGGTVTGTRNATTGAWTSAETGSSLGNNTWHYARATQTDTAGNTWTYITGSFQS